MSWRRVRAPALARVQRAAVLRRIAQVEGAYYGFSGCHRFEAHVKLGLPTIRCLVRPATRHTLKMHMM